MPLFSRQDSIIATKSEPDRGVLLAPAHLTSTKPGDALLPSLTPKILNHIQFHFEVELFGSTYNPFWFNFLKIIEIHIVGQTEQETVNGMVERWQSHYKNVNGNNVRKNINNSVAMKLM